LEDDYDIDFGIFILGDLKEKKDWAAKKERSRRAVEMGRMDANGKGEENMKIDEAKDNVLKMIYGGGEDIRVTTEGIAIIDDGKVYRVGIQDKDKEEIRRAIVGAVIGSWDIEEGFGEFCEPTYVVWLRYLPRGNRGEILNKLRELFTVGTSNDEEWVDGHIGDLIRKDENIPIDIILLEEASIEAARRCKEEWDKLGCITNIELEV